MDTFIFDMIYLLKTEMTLEFWKIKNSFSFSLYALQETQIIIVEFG
jgi:hypothetical protein